MNQSRRNQLRDIRQQLRDIHERLDILCDEELEAYDNMPESIRDSARGDAAQRAIERWKVSEIRCRKLPMR